ncbi:hypothetical protein [Candidatus Odyssella acanthamoebae]|uniref:Uncharacterized protein n=1 Tax=Candidatus Odyssella acanthamoebae TaxID=91604 RepID=A0A077AVQ6_9PROT|nr:hypothetical protein [Candidatus Paracaedibacter acanthamoebae]AIK97232.1 hypothetical protein ID47_11575 [Candidatus Paracaedibacter acanthamoebae]
MKLYFLNLIQLVLTVHAYDSEDDSYFDDINAPYIYQTPTLASSPSLPQHQGLKLVKMDLSKYLERKLEKSNFIVISPEHYELIEIQVSIEIQKTLLWIKKNLEAKHPHNIVQHREEFHARIKAGIENLMQNMEKIGPTIMGLTSLDDVDSKDQKKYYAFLFILDNYYRDQLLRIGYGLLQPILHSSINQSSVTTDLQRLQNYSLADETFIPDTLRTWKRKKFYFCLLNQLTHPSLDLFVKEELIEAKKQIGFNINYSIDHDYLAKFYQDSCSFLTEDLTLLSKEINTPQKIYKITKKIIKNSLRLHEDYQKFFPDHLVANRIKADIESYLAQCLADSHTLFFQYCPSLFLEKITHPLPIEDLKELVTHFFEGTFDIHKTITLYVSDTPFSPITLTTTYQESVYKCTLATLTAIEDLYNNRSLVTKTLTSFGSRTSQTRTFLEIFKSSSHQQFPFLFAPSEHPELSLIDGFAKIEKQMDQMDGSPVETVSKNLYSLLESTGISSWWG